MDTFRVCCFTDMDDLNYTIAQPPGPGEDQEPWVNITGNCTDPVAVPATFYTFSAKQVGTVISCEVTDSTTGEKVLSDSGDAKDVGINTRYPAAVNQRIQVQTRLRNNHPAEAIGYVDNIYVGDNSSALLNVLPAIIAAGQNKNQKALITKTGRLCTAKLFTSWRCILRTADFDQPINHNSPL